MSFVEHPVTGNVGVDIDHTVQIPAPQPAPNYYLVTQTRPLPVLYQGWLLGGAFTSDNVIGLLPGESLQAYYPEPQFIPESAGESPGDGYRFVVIRVITAGGWQGEYSSDPNNCYGN